MKEDLHSHEKARENKKILTKSESFFGGLQKYFKFTENMESWTCVKSQRMHLNFDAFSLIGSKC